MKRCKKCGELDYHPGIKCVVCDTKYDNSYSCDPLSSSRKIDVCADVGYITSGDTNARHNKDYN